jgi:hypothetical protein
VGLQAISGGEVMDSLAVIGIPLALIIGCAIGAASARGQKHNVKVLYDEKNEPKFLVVTKQLTIEKKMFTKGVVWLTENEKAIDLNTMLKESRGYL